MTLSNLLRWPFVLETPVFMIVFSASYSLSDFVSISKMLTETSGSIKTLLDIFIRARFHRCFKCGYSKQDMEAFSSNSLEPMPNRNRSNFSLGHHSYKLRTRYSLSCFLSNPHSWQCTEVQHAVQ